MRKYICSFLSLILMFTLCTSSITASNSTEQLNDENEIKTILDVNFENKQRAVIISKGEGIFVFELYRNNQLVRSDTRDLYDSTHESVVLLSRDGIEAYESQSGWGIIKSDDEDLVFLSASREYDFGEAIDKNFEIQKGIDDNFINQYRLRLKDYISLESQYQECIDGILSAVSFSCVFYFDQPYLAYQAAEAMIQEIVSVFALEDIVDYMAELNDEMAFFYVALLGYMKESQSESHD